MSKKAKSKVMTYQARTPHVPRTRVFPAVLNIETMPPAGDRKYTLYNVRAVSGTTRKDGSLCVLNVSVRTRKQAGDEARKRVANGWEI